MHILYGRGPDGELHYVAPFNNYADAVRRGQTDFGKKNFMVDTTGNAVPSADEQLLRLTQTQQRKLNNKKKQFLNSL